MKQTNQQTKCFCCINYNVDALLDREEVGKLKEGEEDKSKSYVALCWCQRPLTPEDVQKINDTKVRANCVTLLS